MTVWEDPEELDARANHQAIKERKCQALQELERHNFIICCGKDVCRIIIDRIRSGVDDRLRKDRKDIDKEEGLQNKYYTAEHHWAGYRVASNTLSELHKI